jgi:hypothetical protein
MGTPRPQGKREAGQILDERESLPTLGKTL